MDIKDKIQSKVKAKTSKLKDKIKGRVAKKCGKACVLLALLAVVAGCHMGEQPTAQRAQTSTITDNRIDIRVLSATNAVYDAEGNPVAAVRIEIGNLTQANETKGTETMTATPSNTPTRTPRATALPIGWIFFARISSTCSPDWKPKAASPTTSSFSIPRPSRSRARP